MTIGPVSVGQPMDLHHRRWSRFGWPYAMSAGLFLVIPLLFVFAVFQLTKASGPQWLPTTFENPYTYLLNSLLLADGRLPVYIDHPGTTTEVFGGIVLMASNTKSTDDLVVATLKNPERQIRKLHWSLIIVTALMIWLAPYLTALALRSWLVGILIQVPVLFYQISLYYAMLFGSDLMLVPFSIAAVCCCTLLAAPSNLPKKDIIFVVGDGSAIPASSRRCLRIPLLASLAGVICALGIVTKLTFFPLILISLFCCGIRKQLVSFLIVFLLSLLLALFPIYWQLPQLITWVFDLGVHSGKYGAGSIGLPGANAYISALRVLLASEPLLAVITTATVIAAFGLLLLHKKNKSPQATTCKTILFLFGIQLVSFLVIAKHPAIHYIIPLTITTGLNLALLLVASQGAGSPPIGRAIGWLILVGLVLLGSKDFIHRTKRTYVTLRHETADELRLYHHAKAITQNDVRVDYYLSDSPEFPLGFGNHFAGDAFGAVLTRLYPDILFFDIFSGQFENFTESIEPAVVLKKYDHLYFLGHRDTLSKIDGFDPARFETIDHAGPYYLQKWTRK